MTKPYGTPVLPGQVGAALRTDGELRDVMAAFPTGVTVVTTGGNHIHGMTANAFTSVSLQPPLVLVCIARTARMHQAILRTGAFGVSVLTGEQEGIARYFAGRSRPDGAAQFDAEWVVGMHTGVPLLTSAAAWIECEIDTVHDGGDHSVVVGGVLGMGRGESRRALVFYAGRFHHVAADSYQEGEA